MPISKRVRLEMLLLLQAEYDELNQRHNKLAPRNGDIPVGGGDWMDYFFGMEGIRGCQNALRNGETLSKSISQGKIVSEIAIEIWNKRREYQVHRWKKCVHSYLENLIVKVKRQAKTKIASK